MKKLFFLLLATVFFCGCDNTMDELISNETQQATLPMVLHATIADESLACETTMSRTYLASDGKSVFWSKGDEISFFALDGHNIKYQLETEAGTGNADFVPDLETGVEDFTLAFSYGVYPYMESTACFKEGGIEKLTVDFSATQTYAPKSFGNGANVMVAAGKHNADGNLTFQNACGYFIIKLDGEGETIKRIKLSGQGGEKIAGKGHIVVRHNAAPVVTMTDEATSTVTLDCGEGVVLGTEATEFWFALPPVTFENGLEIEITDSYGNKIKKQTANKVQITRNEIQPMETLSMEQLIPENRKLYYTRANSTECLTFINPTQLFDVEISNHYYDSSKGKLVIVFDKPLTTIKKAAFKGMDITSITIPSGVTTIEENAFEGTALTSFTLPGTVNLVRINAFKGCKQLKTVTLDSSPTNTPLLLGSIEYTFHWPDTFSESPIETVIINRQVKECYDESVGGSNYSGLRLGKIQSLKNVTFGEQVTEIHHKMFYYSSLPSITIPATIKSIGYSAFEGCKDLTTVVFEESDTPLDIMCIAEIIGPSDFVNYGPFFYSPLTSITLNRELIYMNEKGKNLTYRYWGEGLFATEKYNEVNMVSMTIGNKVKTIYPYMFNYLKIREITIPGSVINIGNNAFNGCTSLLRVTFEESSEPLRIGFIDEIRDKGPFYYSPLTYINLNRKLDYVNDGPGGLDAWDEGIFANKYYDVFGHIVDVHIGSNVTEILPWMFSGVRFFDLFIPKEVTSIGKEAFAYCYIFEQLTCNHTTPPALGENVFKDCKKLGTIRVLDGYADTFKNADGWKKYADKITTWIPDSAN